MTALEQIEKWLKGESIHNIETNECCPDFSCCVPELFADDEIRKLFYNSYLSNQKAICTELLLGFLGKLIALTNSEIKTYLAGRGEIPTA